MKLLLLLLLAGLDPGLCGLPAPLTLTMSSVNFRHKLHWTAAPDSPPGVKYHVNVGCLEVKKKELVTTKNLWTKVTLKDPHGTYRLCVRSSLNGSTSSWSKSLKFTPYLQTNITSPKVTMSGCGECIQMNITMPAVYKKTEILDMKVIYKDLSYTVSWKQKQKETVESKLATNPTVTILSLLPGTEYCVQVQPSYLDLKIFQPSPWECILTSSVEPSPLFAVVGSVAAVVVVSLSVLVLIFFILQYTGVICKLNKTLPHLLTAIPGHCSLLRLEKTIPEPLFLFPETGRQQSHWDQEEEDQDQETNVTEQAEDQGEDLYMNRGADLSSDSSSESSRLISSFQSEAAVTAHSGSQPEVLEEQKDEQECMIKNQDCIKEKSNDCTEIEEWHKELDKYKSVNLFSVTTTALDIKSDPEHCDVQPLLHTPYQSDTDLQQHLQDDSADQQTQMNYYMRH